MKHLWAPWRMSYVTEADRQEGCIFCAKGADEQDQECGILARARHNYLVLNAFPYNTGHLMIVPYAHESDFARLPPATGAEMFALAQLAVGALVQVFQAEGANIGMNLGKAAGAGVKDHVHLHVVPRWSGDTNFMMPLAETRVVPQSLRDTWAQLSPVLRGLIEERLAGMISGG